jgi:pimeloyl-ACP methyl ester carboxylesterase
MVGYAFAAQYPDRVRRFVLIDAPLPGVGPWEEILKNPLLWHFRFGGPDMERLVAGREHIYLDRFWNEFSANPARFSEAARVHYAKFYAMPGAMHSGFMQFAAFDQDAIDIPVLTLELVQRADALALEVVDRMPHTPRTVAPQSVDDRIAAALANAAQPQPFADLRALCRVRTATLYERLAAMTSTGRVRRGTGGDADDRAQ